MATAKRKRKPTPRRKPLTEDEMVLILEDIARSGQNAAARIAAIRALREIAHEGKPPNDAFVALDGPTQALIRTKAKAG